MECEVRHVIIRIAKIARIDVAKAKADQTKSSDKYSRMPEMIARACIACCTANDDGESCKGFEFADQSRETEKPLLS